MEKDIKHILENVKNGTLSVDEAVLRLKTEPFADLGYAKVDLHRKLRQGVEEIVYGAGKTADEIAGIVRTMREHGQARILITRLSAEKAAVLKSSIPLRYFERASFGMVGDFPAPTGEGYIAVATGGTSDIPVAEEAALTAEALGNEVHRLYDVGVAGLHRLLSQTDEIMNANAIVAVAGMEGALASVIGGLADCPVIAVPTSVGYGAAFGGVSALLAMLNSCAAGVSVVNIDNGFGAGFLASRINHPKIKNQEKDG